MTPQCGFVYDTEGRALRIGQSALSCVLPRGHEGPHTCVYVARVRVANTGPTRPRDPSSQTPGAAHEPR